MDSELWMHIVQGKIMEHIQSIGSRADHVTGEGTVITISGSLAAQFNLCPRLSKILCSGGAVDQAFCKFVIY
jgi:hypothetical protein